MWNQIPLTKPNLDHIFNPSLSKPIQSKKIKKYTLTFCYYSDRTKLLMPISVFVKRTWSLFLIIKNHEPFL